MSSETTLAVFCSARLQAQTAGAVRVSLTRLPSFTGHPVPLPPRPRFRSSQVLSPLPPAHSWRASSCSSPTVSVHSGRLAAHCIAGHPALHPSEARSSLPDPVLLPRALMGPQSPEARSPEVSCSHRLAAALHSNRSSHANPMNKEAWESLGKLD